MQSCGLSPKRQLGDSLRKFRLFSSNAQIDVSLNVGYGYVFIGWFAEQTSDFACHGTPFSRPSLVSGLQIWPAFLTLKLYNTDCYHRQLQ